MLNNIIYTVGHSNHSIDYFKELIDTYKINCIIDVRSVPASTYNPQFNKDALNNYLIYHKIIYFSRF